MTLDKSTPHTLSHFVEKHVSTGSLWRAMSNARLLNSISHLPVFLCFNFHSLQTWTLASRLFLAAVQYHSCLIFHVTFLVYKIRCFTGNKLYWNPADTRSPTLPNCKQHPANRRGSRSSPWQSPYVLYANDHTFKSSPLYTKIVSASLTSSCDFTELLCLIISHWLDELQLRPHETWLWKPSFWH